MSTTEGVAVAAGIEDSAPPGVALKAAPPTESIRLMRDAVVNASGILLPSAMALLLVPVMLNGLGAAVYGLWIAAVAVTAIASSFDLGLGWTLVRQVAADADTTPAPDTVRFFQAAAKAYLLMGFMGSIAVSTLGILARAELDPAGPLHPVAPWIFCILGIALLGERMTAFCVAVLHGMRRFGTAVLLMSGFAVIRAAGVATLLWWGWGVLAVALWHMAAALLCGTGGVLLLRWLQPRFRLRGSGPLWATLRPHLQFGLASQFTSVATSITWQAGALFVGAFASAAAIVPLHVGQRFPLFASGIGWRAAEVAFPAAGQRGKGSPAAGAQILRASTRWPLAAVLPMCLALFVLAPNILQIWLGHVDAEAVAVLRFTCGAVVGDVLGVGAIHLLWGSGQAGTVLKLLGSVAAATVLLTMIMVPLLGAPGAALALAVSLSGGALAALLVTAKACYATIWNVLSSAVARTALPGITCAAAAVVLGRYLQPASWTGLSFTIATTALVYMVAMYWWGLSAQERKTLRRHATHWGQAGPEPGQEQWILRRWLKRVRPLRSFWHFMLDARETFFDSPQRAQLRFDKVHRERQDPWDYLTIPVRGVERFQRVNEVLEEISKGRPFEHALEVGCSEGLYTRELAFKCRALLAVDVSPIALERAQIRCEDFGHVVFRAWDLRREELYESFDLIVAMGVLESLGRPRDLKAAREKLVRLLRPGGWLLVETTRVNAGMEDQWWRRKLHRGRWLNAYIGEHPQLLAISTATEATAIRSVFRKITVPE